jgi:hypothetical protein
MNNKEEFPIEKLAGLNENHKRSIFSTLYLIEKDIDNIERCIEHAPDGRMYKIVNDLNDGQQAAILEAIKSIRDYINELADALHFETHQESLSRIAIGSLSLRWEDACELEAKRLKVMAQSLLTMQQP